MSKAIIYNADGSNSLQDGVIALGIEIQVGNGEFTGVPPGPIVNVAPSITILVDVLGTGMTLVVAEMVTWPVEITTEEAVTVRVVVVVEAGIVTVRRLLDSVPDTVDQTVEIEVDTG